MVGSGGYVLEGVVAKQEAGPVAIFCFLVSGLVTMMAAFCFAEFGVLIPRAGSAYVYVYVTLGEFWAFLVGWNILISTMSGLYPPHSLHR
jgi:amino acid transporter